MYRLLACNRNHWDHIIILQSDQSPDRQASLPNLLKIIHEVEDPLWIIAISEGLRSVGHGVSRRLSGEIIQKLIDQNQSKQVTLITNKVFDGALHYKLENDIAQYHSRWPIKRETDESTDQYPYPYVTVSDTMATRPCETSSCDDLVNGLDSGDALIRTEYRFIEQLASVAPVFKVLFISLDQICITHLLELLYNFFQQPDITYRQLLDEAIINAEADVRLESNYLFDIDSNLH